MKSENEYFKFGNATVVKLSDENEKYLNEMVRNCILKKGYTANMKKEPKKKYKGLLSVIKETNK